MNSELINALISQIGNIVGIPLAAVLAVWQVKKGFTSKRNDEVNEKSFGLCCELFDLVSRNESYNKEVTDKITKMIKERNDSQKLLHPEILRMISEIETYKKILNRIDEKDKLACRREKKIMKRLRKDYEILCAYVSNEDNRLRKALGYPRDTLYSFHVLKYGPAAFFSLAEHIAEIVLILFFGLLVCFIMVSKFSAFAVYLAMALCAATIWGIIGIRYVWDKSKFSFSHWINEKKSEIEKEEMMSNAIKSDAENES